MFCVQGATPVPPCTDACCRGRQVACKMMAGIQRSVTPVTCTLIGRHSGLVHVGAACLAAWGAMSAAAPVAAHILQCAMRAHRPCCHAGPKSPPPHHPPTHTTHTRAHTKNMQTQVARKLTRHTCNRQHVCMRMQSPTISLRPSRACPPPPARVAPGPPEGNNLWQWCMLHDATGPYPRM